MLNTALSCLRGSGNEVISKYRILVALFLGSYRRGVEMMLWIMDNTAQLLQNNIKLLLVQQCNSSISMKEYG